MALNPKAIKLTFSDLKYTVQLTSGIKCRKKIVNNLEIIKGIDGYALPGQTLYIMGSSGAGKTTLLNIISDRISLKRGNTLEGEVMVNDT
jgi:ABC-type multidrug transport system ATPase subunit